MNLSELTSMSLPGRGLPTEAGRESSSGSLGVVRIFCEDKIAFSIKLQSTIVLFVSR